MVLGFGFAAYSVVANDSVQTLGTFIASNGGRGWCVLWLGASVVLVVTLVGGWLMNGGDISYGRLDLIPLAEPFRWQHMVAPLALVVLTRFGIPVSTTFLVLSVFASSAVIGEMLVKSFLGYAVAMASAFAVWRGLGVVLDESAPVVRERLWVVLQWVTTAVLWSVWLSHDLANIAVFLPRELSFYALVVCVVVLVSGLGFMFYHRGGRIQRIVLEKTGTRYVRSATIIDFCYALVLLVFREVSNVPMSTTWVFVGLLAGREFAVKRQGQVFPVVAKDFSKMMVGLAVSVVIVWAAG